MASCTSLASAVSKFWSTYGKIISDLTRMYPGLPEPAIVVKAVEKLIGRWNSFFGQGQFRIGPRQLTFGKLISGNLMVQRCFIAVRQTLKPSRLVITKTGGKKKKTTITVCGLDKNSRHRVEREFTLTNRDRDGKKITVNIPKDLLVVVILKGSVGMNALKYTVKLSERARATTNC